MFDARLRPLKDRIATPVAGALPDGVPPLALTGLSLLAGLAAAGVAATGETWTAVACWWVSRVADGLDGALARRRGTATDLGGYLDQMADTVVYAAIPLGVAVAVDDRATWVATAVLLGVLYLNTVSWAYLSALIEKRNAVRAVDRVTSIEMPSGLVEGAETIVLYSLLLAAPGWQPHLTWLLAMMVMLTVLHRIARSRFVLR